ncbi:MAG: FAD-dependent oxidoreductase [Gammaproteobacteria bacterium]|nr:FAD-dependent oxidoreductase [Gammaproteobacteria bacterium]MYK83233.1 FAD-dependent oxidoreductase [Gammaproteobacteria bacterium]
MKTQVVIVGAGPVGLSAAMDLAKRGIDAVVVESRSEDEPADAKCNTIAARTMEIFRQFGVADQVRACGLTDSYATDVVYATEAGGIEITRIVQPSRNERLGADGVSAPGFPDSHWETPEPVVRASQLYLNPILLDRAKTYDRITLLTETTFLSYEDGGDQVKLACRSNSGEELVIEGRYLIGCDGASSAVRKQMGVKLEGDVEISKMRTTLVRCPEIRELLGSRPGWMTWVLNPRVTGVIVAIDGDELWLIHRNVHMSADFDSVHRDQSIRDMLGVGQDFTWEAVHHQDWTARRMVASRFRQNNVFVCGDAAHIWVPFAGYGMNAGIADANNLSWMMAAVLNGQADERLLEAHERERHPITEQVSQFAMNKALEYLEAVQGRKIPKLVESRSFLGRLLRKRMGRRMYDMNVPQFACEGLNFGYYYDDSPIIHYDGEAPPEYEMGRATPSTVPGCRLPHFWMSPGKSIYDELGPVYTLLCYNGSRAEEPFAQAFEAAGLPLKILSVDSQPDVYTTNYVLARTDQHVAWRGDVLPENADDFVSVCGGRPNA